MDKKNEEIERLRESCRSLHNENKRLLNGNAGLREDNQNYEAMKQGVTIRITDLEEDNKRLRDAVHVVDESARVGGYLELICNGEDFAALTDLVEEITNTNQGTK